MNKKDELKEIIKAKILKTHKSGKLKEDWVSNWINKIFDKTTQRVIEKDPIIKALKKDSDDAIDDAQKAFLKRYKSYDKVPDIWKKMLWGN